MDFQFFSDHPVVRIYSIIFFKYSHDETLHIYIYMNIENIRIMLYSMYIL